MRELTNQEINEINGAKRNIFTVITGAVWGATFGAILGIPAGPPGIIAGAGAGVFNGVAVALAKEGAEGLVAIRNGEGI
jgi:hypothetical protein